MALYGDHVLPCLTHLAMSNRRLIEYRRRMVSQARGRVLETGIGSGLNLPFYGGQVASVYGIDPSAALLRRAGRHPAPCWKCLGGGCHLNRKIDDLVTASGFHIDELDTGYMQGRNPFAFMYVGVKRTVN